MTTLLPENTALSLTRGAINSGGVAIDTETNAKDLRDGRGYCMGVSLAYRDATGITALYLPFRHAYNNYSFHAFRDTLQNILDSKQIVFHNAKFDLVSLATLGLDTSRVRFYDTMLLAHLVDENNPVTGKGLDSLVKYYLKSDGKQKTQAQAIIEKALGWDFVPPEVMAGYATWDAALTYQLFEFLKPKLQAEKLQEVWKHKEKFTRLVMEMELKGVGIDTDRANQQREIGEKRMTEIVNELEGLNPSSPKDLAALILGKLRLPEYIHPKTGRRTFDKNAMEEYEIILNTISDPTARLILEYRGWQKAVSSNYIPYVNLLSPDGRLRCNYKLHGTRTGRSSCENPNLQQIPRSSDPLDPAKFKPWNGEMKKVFIPLPGYQLWEFDYSQLELRLGTAYAREPGLTEVFAEGRDIFSEMAQTLGMTRYDTKTMVYSIQYGAGVRRIQNVFGISATAAKQRIDNYYNSYPAFRGVSRQVEQIVYRYGKVPLWSGRFRHFDYPESQGYKAFNSVIQGGAADIVENVMLALDREFSSGDCRMLLTVHDSVIFEIADERVAELVPAIKEVMQDVNSATGQNFPVKFAVEAKRWGE